MRDFAQELARFPNGGYINDKFSLHAGITIHSLLFAVASQDRRPI
jgi:hypothetical protein